jgi:cellulose 1,4-beta-cellobiosidase
MEDDNTYKLFNLKNKEFTYTVDDSNLDCGLNGALYFVQMDADGGKQKYGNAGAEMGLGYCDAQCPRDLKFINGEANLEDWMPSDTDTHAGTGKYGSCCTEIDIWEANKQAFAYTMHACNTPQGQTRCSDDYCAFSDEHAYGDVSLCDKNGCDIQPHRLGVHNFFGPGADFQIDSTQPLQVTTQFITEDGTDTGKLVQVKQLYMQNGKTIEHPEYTVNGMTHNTITDEFCSDWIETTNDDTLFLKKGGLDAIDKALEAGVVLVMSLWDDHYANMLWLDSTYPVDSTDPGAMRGSCSKFSGAPADVEKDQANAHVIFSDIRFGPIGSTVDNGSVAV